MFPHHHQVPLYFAKHIHAKFVLHMHPDYTSTPSNFYGASGGRSAMRPGARRDPAAQLEPQRLVGIPSRTLLRTEDVDDQSQVATEERSSLAQATRMAIHGTLMAVQAERVKTPTTPTDPELKWVDDDVICLLDPQTLAEYAITARDAYFLLQQRCRPRPTGQVYLYTITYSFECFNIKLYVVI